MQLRINERYLKQQTRIGWVLLGVTFCLLLLGLVLSLQLEQWVLEQRFEPWVPMAMTYGIVIVGLTLYYFGTTRMRRFGPQHRQDGRLRQLMKGLDDRYALYSFLGRGLPDYTLVGPSGVYVLVTRPHQGEISCANDRWTQAQSPLRRIVSTFYGNPLRSPSYDAQEGVKRVQALLQERLPGSGQDVPVNGLVVFTGERVKLRVERCKYPATSGKEVRRVVGRAKSRLSAGRLAEVRAVFDSVAVM